MTGQSPLATTGELAAALGAELIGPADIPIMGVGSLDDAAPGALAFIRSARYAARWQNSKASAALVSRGIEVQGHDPSSRALLVVNDADLAMVELLKVAQERLAPPLPDPGVHRTASIGDGASIADSATVCEFAVIGAGAVVGEHAFIGPHSVLADGVKVGDATTVHARVTLMRGTTIGRNCELFPGAVIGGDGFGYLPGPEGPIKIPHIGGVRIGDGVEIGSNTTIDRGKFSDTVIGDATKIDNQVQVGHTCKIGKGVIICGCCAIGGSVNIGDGAMLGGHVSVRDNITIEPGAQAGGASAIERDMHAREPWFGWPARPVSVSVRAVTALYKLPEMRTNLRDLLKRVRALEERSS